MDETLRCPKPSNLSRQSGSPFPKHLRSSNYFMDVAFSLSLTYSGIGRIRTQAERRWIEKARRIFDSQPLVPSCIAPGVFEATSEALDAEKVLEILLRAPKDCVVIVCNRGHPMTSITIRDLPDDVHHALRVRATLHGRSIEAEVLSILESIALPPERVKLGSLLVSIAREAGGLTDAEVEQINGLRDKAPAEPPRWE